MEDYRIGGTWEGCDEQVWRRHKYVSARVPQGLSRQGWESGQPSIIVLARRIDRAEQQTKLHCFLPLDVPSQLRWLVQADFDPTPGRERLRENDWNDWLLDQVGLALAKAIRHEARAGIQPWSLIPLASEVTDDLQRYSDYPGITDTVREADLAVTTGSPVSYVVSDLFDDLTERDRNRAKAILDELGASVISCGHVNRLLAMDDAVFYRQ